MRTDSKALYDFLSDDQISILERHLQSRFANNYRNEKFNVVFDLLHQCDINCVGCGTNAICIKGIQKIENPELTFEDIEKICNCSELTSKMLRISSVWRIRQIKFQKQS